MCGIFGLIAPGMPNEIKGRILANLARATQVRGTDATGVAFLQPSDDDGHVSVIYKQPLAADKFVQTDWWKQFVAGDVPDVVIGHCRAKTQGTEKDNKNNHPIYSKETGLVLIHNGGVNDKPWRWSAEGTPNPFVYQPFDGEVDSEAILRLVETMLYIPRTESGDIDPEQVMATPKTEWTQEVSLAQAISDAVYNLSGGQACVILDPEEPNTLHLWRTTNPLFFGYIPKYDAVFFSSTPEIARSAFDVTVVDRIYNFFNRTVINRDLDYIGKDLSANTLVRMTISPDSSDRFSFDTFTLEPNKGSPVFVSEDKVKAALEAHGDKSPPEEESASDDSTTRPDVIPITANRRGVFTKEAN